jgi:hypothetical protein
MAGLFFHQLAAGETSSFFIAGKEQNHRTFGDEVQSGQGAQCFQGHHTGTFHVEDSWPIESASLSVQTLGTQRTARMNRISVPKQQRCAGVVSSTIERADPQMFAIPRNRDSFDGADRWD